MLRRHRLIRMQIYQLMDACIFAASFWLAYVLRSDQNVTWLLNLVPINEFRQYVWLYLILIPAAPFILEAQGFYNRPLLCSRPATLWILFKSCLLTVMGLILVAFAFQMIIA